MKQEGLICEGPSHTRWENHLNTANLLCIIMLPLFILRNENAVLAKSSFHRADADGNETENIQSAWSNQTKRLAYTHDETKSKNGQQTSAGLQRNNNKKQAKSFMC